MQSRLGSHPDVPLAIFEERLHDITRQAVLGGDVVDARDIRSASRVSDPQAAPASADPDAAPTVLQEAEAVLRAAPGACRRIENRAGQRRAEHRRRRIHTKRAVPHLPEHAGCVRDPDLSVGVPVRLYARSFREAALWSEMRPAAPVEAVHPAEAARPYGAALVLGDERHESGDDPFRLTVMDDITTAYPGDAPVDSKADPQTPVARAVERGHLAARQRHVAEFAPGQEIHAVEPYQPGIRADPDVAVAVLRDRPDARRRQTVVLRPGRKRVVGDGRRARGRRPQQQEQTDGEQWRASLRRTAFRHRGDLGVPARPGRGTARSPLPAP